MDKTAGENTKSEWTIEREEESLSGDKKKRNLLSEMPRDKTVVVDPIELLAGALPSRELKQAQQQAKDAVRCYIEAANILMRLQQAQQQQTSLK